MTKLPSKISVLGIKYKVIRKLPKGHTHEKAHIYGLCDHENKFIYVQKSLNKEQSWRTLLHETQHLIDYRSGLTFTDISGDALEMHAEANASAMYELIEQLGGWDE